MGRSGTVEEVVRGGPLTQAAANQKDDVAGEAAHLAKVVRRHDDLRARLGGGEDDLLDEPGRGRVEAGRRLIQEEDFRLAGQRPRQRQSLLFDASAAIASARPN